MVGDGTEILIGTLRPFSRVSFESKYSGYSIILSFFFIYITSGIIGQNKLLTADCEIYSVYLSDNVFKFADFLSFVVSIIARIIYCCFYC